MSGLLIFGIVLLIIGFIVLIIFTLIKFGVIKSPKLDKSKWYWYLGIAGGIIMIGIGAFLMYKGRASKVVSTETQYSTMYS